MALIVCRCDHSVSFHRRAGKGFGHGRLECDFSGDPGENGCSCEGWEPRTSLDDGGEHMPWCDGKHDESISCAGHLTRSKLEVEPGA